MGPLTVSEGLLSNSGVGYLLHVFHTALLYWFIQYISSISFFPV